MSDSRPRYWLHALLLAATLLTTTAAGCWFAYDFERNTAPFTEEIVAYAKMVRASPSMLLAGLPFSCTLLAILMAHELGHYFACGYYGVDASLPYFLPFPSPIGTMGAFIRIRSPMYYKEQLFDIGVAGPLAGFLFLLPLLAIGIAYSKVMPGIASEGDFVFGAPLLQRWFCALIFPGVPVEDLYLHPIARAAWGGMFATALNLLPIGQLDGGHILYAFRPQRHRVMSKVLVAGLAPCAYFFWPGWGLFCLLFLIFGVRHPVIHDPRPLGKGRVLLGLLAAAIFVLCFSFAPITTGAFHEL